MIAYLFWHCAYPTTTAEQYEEALMRFQQRLGQQQPPGFRGSASFRVAALPWLGNRPGYEDWCLLDGSRLRVITHSYDSSHSFPPFAQLTS
jgi:hypothetical protein